MIRDHHRGSNIYNLNTREKIAYATSIPFRYVTLSAAVSAPVIVIEEAGRPTPYAG